MVVIVKKSQKKRKPTTGNGNKTRSTKPSEAALAAADAEAGGVATPGHKASESQLHVTYKQGAEPLPLRGTHIRAQELSPGPAATAATVAAPAVSFSSLFFTEFFIRVFS